MKYKNPIIPGFYPDPSICRVGEDYYLVTSTFHFFPGVPIFHSKDLINWKQIGHCLTTKTQLNLDKAKSSAGIFAPTIRYNNGTFYMITTNETVGKNFYVYTDDIYGKWSDPVWLNKEGIDPSFFFDDDGKVYFTYTIFDGIMQSEIDIANGKLLSLPKSIWKGTGGRYPEAPHVYKINGMYYLMLAEGGTEYGHMVTIARSSSPWGPFESCPSNPVLTHRDRGTHPIQALGHADLVQAQNGSWWAVFLGIRPRDYPPVHHLGREVFLAPVKWSDDNWPVFYNNGTIELEMETDNISSKISHNNKNESFFDDFNKSELDLSWIFLRNPDKKSWSLDNRPGWLCLTGLEINLNAVDSPAFVGFRQKHFDFEAKTLLEFNPLEIGNEAGLTVYMNEEHHYEIGIINIDNSAYLFVRKNVGDLSAIVVKEKFNGEKIILRISGDINNYYFAYSKNDNKLKTVASGRTKYLSTEVAGGFTGVILGIYAAGSGNKSISQAFFDWFEYTPKNKSI